MKRIFRHLIFSLIVWTIFGMIIAIISLSNPVLEEPEDLPSETWSYYRGLPPPIEYMARHRNEILIVLFVCAVGVDIALLITDYRKNKK